MRFCLTIGFVLLFQLTGYVPAEETGLTVRFPQVTEPRAITTGPKEHLFASYYGINSWNASQRYATVLETDVQTGLPTEDQPATLGLVDMQSNQFIPLAETRAWNFQQGCMAHWLGGAPERQIIYNDLRDGQFVSVVMDVMAKKELRVIPHPVAAVSPNGREAISFNFARLRHTRPGYGYGGNGQDARLDDPWPDDDGLFLVDLETGDAKLLVSLAQVKQLAPEVPEGGIEYFNHALFSRDGSKIFWLARAIPNRNTTALTIRRDGTELRRCFPDGWGGSHFDWLDGNRLMITAKYADALYAHVLFTVGKDDYVRLGNGLLDYDGHGTFSPDGRLMVTDTYPYGGLREQRLYLMDMASEAVLPLGRYPQPARYTKEARCDLHPRWSPKGNLIGINSAHSGSRQAYVLELKRRGRRSAATPGRD